MIFTDRQPEQRWVQARLQPLHVLPRPTLCPCQVGQVHQISSKTIMKSKIIAIVIISSILPKSANLSTLPSPTQASIYL